ncbi:hypothetical protein [Heyndrickxia coagulans]|uniref:hypothetical protein n=1 Tax=Heyndrickxia coagulans TaxID=1398 RepID=UPI0039903AC8
MGREKRSAEHERRADPCKTGQTRCTGSELLPGKKIINHSAVADDPEFFRHSYEQKFQLS